MIPDKTIHALATIVEAFANIEGMKAANEARRADGYALAYDERDFFHIAGILSELAESFEEKTL